MSDAVLTLNAGSSSLKFSLFEAAPAGLRCIADGEIEEIGRKPRFVARQDGAVVAERAWDHGEALTHEQLLGELLGWAESHLGEDRLAAVGHRVAHGGVEFSAPVLLDGAVLAKLDALCPLAPLHQPHNLAAVRAIMSTRPRLPQVACFDTAFHSGHAPEVDRFGLPREWEARGVKRYGFHGLSFEFIARRMRELDPALAAGRMVVAHLGSGASLCAVRDGRSVDTTMSFTPLDGLVMGTRCGALDPGVILYLEQQHGLDAGAVTDLLYHQSGLLGVSQISSDMRLLLASDDSRAKDAVDLFVFRVVRETGAMIATLGGVDGLVFTGGIGEHAPEIRARVCQRLAWLGASLDGAANARGDGRINAPGAGLSVWAVRTDEERMIAAHTWETVR
ncbi:MAG TPA: acetate/propionate family kinase [Caulobacteraceae bacterium]|nr:acetate/propionate family kinase [Caulobacteraceae bacterium]